MEPNSLNGHLNVFHDFEIIYMVSIDKILYAACKSTYYQVVEAFPELIILNFLNFTKIDCTYLDFSPEPDVEYPSISEVPLKETRTDYLRLIGDLNFDIQTMTFDVKKYTLVCNGFPYTAGGTISIDAEDLIAKDINGNLISLEKFDRLEMYRTRQFNLNESE